MASVDKTKPPAGAAPTNQVFVARQPIMDLQGEIFGYELLFRAGMENYFPADTNQDFAASKVLFDAVSLFGLDTLLDGKRGFLNFTRKLILEDAATLFPKEHLVVEVLENVQPDAEILAHCQRLKQTGYTLALDDFVLAPEWQGLAGLADVIKVDVRSTNLQACAEIIRTHARPGLRFLAEKVETQEELHDTQALGFSLFQGYYFSKPVIIQGRDIAGFKLNYLQLMREVFRPDLDLKQMSAIIQRDVALTYKLLRFVNSASFGLVQRIESLNHALTLLGSNEIRKWFALVIIAGMGHDKPQALSNLSLVRGRFCELMAPVAGFKGRGADLFLMGMFSLIDAFLDRPMAEVLAPLPLAEDVKKALLGEPNRLHDLLALTLAYEKGAWNRVGELTQALRVPAQTPPLLYFQSVELANQVFRSEVARS